MNRLKTYSIALSLLIASIAASYLIFLCVSRLSFGDYVDPIHHLFLFGPTISALIFLSLSRDNIVRTVGINKLSNVSGVIMPIILTITAVILSIVIQNAYGFIRPASNEGFFYLFRHQFSPLWGSLIWLLLLLIHAGFAEEFAWRGYLYSQVKHLPWTEQILLINTVWAIWHFPFMPFQRPEQYALFWVQCLEFGTVLVYTRAKTQSVISAMLLHALVVFSLAVISTPYFSVVNSSWAGWPNYTIAILFLPVGMYYFVKGQRETKGSNAI